MSSTLCWKPVVPQEGNSLPFELKKVISPRYFNHDGSCGGSGVVLTAGDIAYFTGLIDAHVQGADTVVNAIKHHGCIELYFET